MKLYLENLTINNLIQCDKLHIKDKIFNKIYSEEGIFIIENNSILRLDFFLVPQFFQSFMLISPKSFKIGYDPEVAWPLLINKLF